MNTIHFLYWTDSDHKQVSRSRSFKQLATVALSVLNRWPMGEIHMVSGPISTGGVGSIDGNRAVFEATIESLVGTGVPVFSQMPFEDKMVELYLKWHTKHPEASYCLPILSDFYEPIFLSGRIKVIHFIFGYESSFGAKWEYDNAARWGIERRCLPKQMLRSGIP